MTPGVQRGWARVVQRCQEPTRRRVDRGSLEVGPQRPGLCAALRDLLDPRQAATRAVLECHALGWWRWGPRQP